jgi:hypothetical protein
MVWFNGVTQKIARREVVMMVKVECRRGYALELPCNWVVGGVCGEDARNCVIKREIR